MISQRLATIACATRRAASVKLAQFALGLTLAASCAVTAAADTATPATTAPKVLRLAFQVAETSFDPAATSDTYSRVIIAHIAEGLYRYDHLARPAKAKLLLAADFPTIENDFKTWTIKIKPGIYFADDPAFKGQKREVTAHDFVYALKRFADPKVKSPAWSYWDSFQIRGLKALREAQLKNKDKPFDYDTPIEGVRALDRHTLQFNLDKPAPRFLQALTQYDLYAPIAREVADMYGDAIGAHPVGTGPFKLKQWRRSSLIVLERNPDYREVYYDAEPAANDAEGQALLARFKGRRLPMVDRVEVSIVEEQQPRWLSFLNQQYDFHEFVSAEFISAAMPNGKLAPNLAKQGIQAYQRVRAEVGLWVFNMEDKTVGGNAPEKVALRRAIVLGYDGDKEIRLARHGQAIAAQSVVNPDTVGYDPKFKSLMSEYSPAKAHALLDLYGYTDRDGDGWRDMPDGSPLVLEISSQPDSNTRRLDELRQKSLNALRIRSKLIIKKWPEQLKAVRAGNFMMWPGVSSTATAPDGFAVYQRYHGPQGGQGNLARFKLPEMDAIYDRAEVIPDGPERLELLTRANRLAAAYMPYRATGHRVFTDMAQPWLTGYRRPSFWNYWWHMVDIDASKVPGSGR